MGKPVIVIVGPTCSGKTDIGIKLAEKISGEIISADSRQIFKLLNIGTATPSEPELNSTKHHFINMLYPDEKYDVSVFEKEALHVIEQIQKNGKYPIIVGGSGLYIKAIIDGIFDVGSDAEYRESLMLLRQKNGNEYLYSKLKEKDPESAAKMLPSNWKRFIRALEVLYVTGKPIWQVQKEHDRETNLNFIQFGLSWKREELYNNINNRVEQMINTGLVNEVKYILQQGYSSELNSLNTVGYKEVVSYLNNQISLERAVELIKRNTRRFAKRQMTWFRKDDRIKWLEVSNKINLDKIAVEIMTSIIQKDAEIN